MTPPCGTIPSLAALLIFCQLEHIAQELFKYNQSFDNRNLVTTQKVSLSKWRRCRGGGLFVDCFLFQLRFCKYLDLIALRIYMYVFRIFLIFFYYLFFLQHMRLMLFELCLCKERKFSSRMDRTTHENSKSVRITPQQPPSETVAPQRTRWTQPQEVSSKF